MATGEKQFPPALIQALGLLAAGPDDQRNALPEWVAFPDEVALVFEDAYLSSNVSDLTIGEAALMAAISQRLESMWETPEAWTPDAIDAFEGWTYVRELARAALASLGLSLPSTMRIGQYVRYGSGTHRPSRHRRDE